MYPGQATLCLKTVNLSAMRQFYEGLGFKVHEVREHSVLLNNGDLDLALMTFLPAHCVNYRGADVQAICDDAVALGQAFSQSPTPYKKEQHADADGTSWMVIDPDGNQVFFDTNELETGVAGKRFALQRVLDAIAKQLINVGAPAYCMSAFRQKVVRVYRPADHRQQSRDIDTSVETETGEFAGFFNYCLKTTDNAVSKAFYQSLGIEVTGNDSDSWVLMGTADFSLSLMTHLDENWLNFRGANVFELNAHLSQLGFELEGEPSTYAEEDFGMPGMHWQTRDPDGNVLYFDTADVELVSPGDPQQLARTLQNGLERLQNIEASQACIDGYQRTMLDRKWG